MKDNQYRDTLQVGSQSYTIFSLAKAAAKFGSIDSLPFSKKILLENLLRHLDGDQAKEKALQSLASGKSGEEIAYHPARVLLQDFTGVPAVVDLAAMRDAMEELGGDIKKINPLTPVDLVIDHSVMVDFFGSSDSFERNVKAEFGRNKERYAFLRWGQQAFSNFRVVPPGTGICHQVNLEYLAQVVRASSEDGQQLAFPDTVVGTDSHTTMVNGLGVLGWGVGGIEAESAMLGQAISMLIPEVIGVRVEGELREGVTATDLVLYVTEMLRKRGVVEKFVEFCGPGLDSLSLADRATISNMAPEYGATCGIFPVDEKTIAYMKLTGRSDQQQALVKEYMIKQGMWRDASSADPKFADLLHLDLGAIEAALAGPKRPQDRVLLGQMKDNYTKTLKGKSAGKASRKDKAVIDGDVVIAAITSCTNTSNPSVMVAAGLVARKALALGITSKPWVKTSLAPGSQVVSDYLRTSGLDKDLDELGFNLVGYGCTTCIGNSGPLDQKVTKAITENDLSVVSVLSGNRNFEGRVNPLTKANYLASPPLVVAYALAGSALIDLTKEPVATNAKGEDIYLKDIWPSSQEIADIVAENVVPKIFSTRYADVFTGSKEWQEVEVEGGDIFEWNSSSTYVQQPPYFINLPKEPKQVEDIVAARALLMMADSVTTDHISPAGSFRSETPAGKYLTDRQVAPASFNSFGARRGNHEVMMRGTFANIRIRNEMLDNVEGGFTLLMPEKKQMSVYDAAVEYRKRNVPVIVVAGKEYGTGSSRDWAAKGPLLLGVRAVVVESYERIHRSNLIGMGILPLEFVDGASRKTLKLDGSEEYSILGLSKDLKRRSRLELEIKRASGKVEKVPVLCRIDTDVELEYYRNGGVLSYVLRQLAA